MEDTKIFLELSPGQEETLADNEMGIEDILDHHNLQVERVTTEQRPYQSEQGVQTKDLVTTIIAGSVAITALAMAISQVLTTLQQKPTSVTGLQSGKYYHNLSRGLPDVTRLILRSCIFLDMAALKVGGSI